MASIDTRDVLKAAYSRALRARERAEALSDAGFPDAALVWAVRASEIFVRDFILLPHYLESGMPWPRAVKKARRDLQAGWGVALQQAEEWYGPFDEPLMADGQNAWAYWKGTIIGRRGEVVHGNIAPDVTVEEAEQVIAFARRLSSWWVQGFFVSERHPLGQGLLSLLRAATEGHPVERGEGDGQ